MKQADGIKRHFDVVAERLMAEIAQVAEGVINLGEKFDREIKDFREENNSAHKDVLACSIH